MKKSQNMHGFGRAEGFAPNIFSQQLAEAGKRHSKNLT
jgi:hypothetical protein